MTVGRFAPSPSGRMHLGNLYTALVSWLSVRKQGGTWILRIEDLDPQRSKPQFARQIEDDLRWLGLDWDEGGLKVQAITDPMSRASVIIFIVMHFHVLRRWGLPTLVTATGPTYLQPRPHTGATAG